MLATTATERSFLRCKPRKKDMKFKLVKYVMFAVAIAIAVNVMNLTAYLPKLPVIAALTTATAPSSSTIAGVKTAKWGSNVKLSYAGNNFTFVSNGIPNHPRPAEYAYFPDPRPGVMGGDKSNAFAAADRTKSQNYKFTIPVNPTKSAKPTSTSMGSIGAMISGAVLFNPYEGDNTSVATTDNFTVKNSKGQDVGFLDSCNGHPQPMMGDYHYHALPTCITRLVDKVGKPSHLIGVAFDGFPIYGDRAMNCSKIVANQLDTCNGITSATPEFPKGIYHYVLLDTKDSTSSIRCFSGKSSVTMKMPGMNRPPRGRPGRPPLGPPWGRPLSPPPNDLMMTNL
jgi:YHYH protein